MAHRAKLFKARKHRAAAKKANLAAKYSVPGVAALTGAALRSPLSARERGSVFAALAHGDTQGLAGARLRRTPG